MKNYKQHVSVLPVDTIVFIATKFIKLSTKVNDVHNLLIAIYPPVRLALILFELSQDSEFTVSVFNSNHFWVYQNKKGRPFISDLIGIYPAVKFQICSLILSDLSQDPDFLTDGRTEGKLRPLR